MREIVCKDLFYSFFTIFLNRKYTACIFCVFFTYFFCNYLKTIINNVFYLSRIYTAQIKRLISLKGSLPWKNSNRLKLSRPECMQKSSLWEKTSCLCQAHLFTKCASVTIRLVLAPMEVRCIRHEL